jgi:predicted outer membrane repeat protein
MQTFTKNIARLIAMIILFPAVMEMKAQDTLHVESHIFVPQGETYEIPAGTVVYFHGYYHLWVEGTLLAEGTEEQPILFTAADTTNLHNTHLAEGGWMGIRFFAEEETRINGPSMLKHCTFEFAKSSKFDFENGGAITIEGPADVEVENCIFRYNYAYRRGGAIYMDGNNARISRSFFHNNTANNTEHELWTYGGAIFVIAGRPEISWCRFEENFASGIGGAMAVETADPHVFNNIIHNNNSPLGGGIGILRAIGANFYSNNLITDNYSEFFGGGIAFIETSVNVANNTILNNYAAYGGGLYFNEFSSPKFYNCIVRDNTVYTGSNQVFIWDSQSAPEFYNCNMEGGFDAFDGGAVGDGFLGVYQDNLDEDPLFEDPDNGIFMLLPGSPSKDTGHESSDELGIFQEDLAGNTRFSGPAIDMGAFEFQYNYFELILSVQGNGETNPGPGTYSLYEGAPVSITTSPNEDAYFMHWITPWGNHENDTLEFEISENMEIIAVFGALGMHDQAIIEQWQIFPNPVEDFISISLPPGVVLPSNIIIRNSSGVRLFKHSAESQEIMVPFDFRQLTPGVYFLTIQTADKEKTFRILKI